MARVIFLMLETERTFRLIARVDRMAGILAYPFLPASGFVWSGAAGLDWSGAGAFD
jgi:hypothetical protein